MSSEQRLRLEHGHHFAGRRPFLRRRRRVHAPVILAASHADYKFKTELHGFIAELRLFEGSPRGAPYLYRKVKETHALIFSLLSRLAVLLVGAYARR